MNQFDLQHEYTPSGDQPEAIKSLVAGLKKGMGKQTLLGATGTGKTFTIANVIEQTQKTTLVIAHNKTLAAQLAQEFREFFPNNAVHYFVSYYDYYQPEAYIAVSDTFIEKDASINEKIDRLRHASTQSLLSRPDTIIVASVSCIYGLGSPEDYLAHNLFLKKGDTYARNDLMKMFVSMHYSRTTADVANSSFRVLGNVIEIMPVADTFTYRLELEGNILVRIDKMDPVSSTFMEEDIESVFIFPAKHFMTNDEKKTKAIKAIRKELKIHLSFLEKKGLLLEAERLKRRTNYDLAMMEEIGYCSGIENYSRHLSGKKEGEAPETLISYFPHKKDGSPDFLTVVDESHVTLPQLRAMHAGDASRKNNLIEYGFRLPSARDNRPLKYEEFEKKVGQTIYVSATPGGVEKEISDQIVEQVIRPTGLVDPEIDVRPIIPKGKYEGQVKDFIQEAQKEIEKGNSILCTTLTKKMAEDLSEFLKDEGIKAEYLHSDIKTIDRIRILTKLRKGEIRVLVGVNLLREGLDLPEVTLVAVLDADKEGFLRSDTALIQTIGRAARNVCGRVILYADRITNSMGRAIEETNRRREKQVAYNEKNGITPETIKKHIHDIAEDFADDREKAIVEELNLDMELFDGNKRKIITLKKKKMKEAVVELDFETAALLRDQIILLESTIKKRKSKTKKK